MLQGYCFNYFLQFADCWKKVICEFRKSYDLIAVILTVKGKSLVSYCVVSKRKDWLENQDYLFDLFRDPSDSVCVLTLTINIIRTRDGISPIVTIDPLCGRGIEHRYSMEHWFLTARVALSMVTKGAWIYLMLAPICVPVTAWDDNLVQSHWKPSENLTKSMLHL